MSTIRAIHGDITALAVDAIVNAANARLEEGSGVNGAIQAAAGPALLAACREIGGCPTGQAVITPGFDLPARHVIHAVGPVWQGGAAGEAQLLAGCYRNSLALAAGHGLASIAFPAISCGVYGYPAEQAAHVAVTAVRAALAEHPGIESVVFCLFSEAMLDLYRHELIDCPA